MNPSPVQQVAVLRALQLGDLLCAVPTFRALRRAHPGASVALVGLPWARDLVGRLPHLIDEFIEFPGYPGLPERAPDIGRIPRFLGEMQRRRFDLVIQLHGSGGVVNPLVALFGAGRVAGYYRPGEFCPDPLRFMPYPEDGSEVRRLLRLISFLGMPLDGEQLELLVTGADRARLRGLPGASALEPGAYVCVHPGARFPSRRWPRERFAAAADILASRGFQIVLTGSESERALAAGVAAAMRAPAVDLSGWTDLGGLAALVADAALVLCNDTGVSHVAAAVGTPSVVVASGSDVARWAPLDGERHRVLWQDVPCRPCEERVCPIDHLCALRVTVEAVVAEAERLLEAFDRRPLRSVGGEP